MRDQLGSSAWMVRLSVGDQDQGELEDQQQQGPGQPGAVPDGQGQISGVWQCDNVCGSVRRCVAV